MKCKVKDCDRDAQYKRQQVCQKHYFRYMRNGTYDIVNIPTYRTSNPAGYQLIHEPEHPLSDSSGRVYEHRFVYFNNNNGVVSQCAVCGSSITWKTCHIDHMDNDVTNNDISNLRATCAPCNIFRGHSCTSMGSVILTVDGVTMSSAAWSRQEGVEVCGATIARRKSKGMSDYYAIFSPRKTHKTTKTKKYDAKYDEERGIKNKYNHKI